MSQTYRVTEIKWDKGCLDLMDPLDAERAKRLPSEVTFVFCPDGNWGGLKYNVRKSLEADGYGCRVLSFKVSEVTGQPKKSRIRKEYMQMILAEIGTNRPISDDYWPRIAEAIIDDVIRNVEETADPEEWNEDDVRLAVGRVLCGKLGLEV